MVISGTVSSSDLAALVLSITKLVMNRAADKNNIAEILVEKHRNGPTGSVELYFDEKRVTFMDLETSEFDALAGAPIEEHAE